MHRLIFKTFFIYCGLDVPFSSLPEEGSAQKKFTSQRKIPGIPRPAYDSSSRKYLFLFSKIFLQINKKISSSNHY
ncbi:hypothetical protein CNEO4_1260025 [Clostridium neonatale]|nr:hypothetical protein CNEO4_1260025 [Clostridium neonatale]CAI3656987.1 hypothetical protein CNEO3_680005 [Clostridium neonatale]